MPEMAPGTIPVLVLPNGRDVVHTSSYEIKPRPSLLKAEPPTGTMTGGHVVTVHGSRLATLKSARCSFSGVLSRGGSRGMAVCDACSPHFMKARIH